MTIPPSGTVTFLFTDIEGSTKRWEGYPQQMQAALARHDALLRVAIEENAGYVFKTVGDAFCAVFSTPFEAFQAALSIQRTLYRQEWPQELDSIRVRVALHTGVAEEQGGDYFGPPVNRVARLLSAGHGGQILLSRSAYELSRDTIPVGVSLLDLGEHRLKDLIRPEHIFQLADADLPQEFPPLKTLDSRPNNLPLQPTPFIGREKELAELVRLANRDDVRLLTLTGPAGTGKTRLGLQVSADLLEEFADGVWFVELAALTEPGPVISTLAHALGIKESGDQPLMETLKAALRDKHLLIMLDNFEQVISTAPQVGQLLAACAQVKILVTSRVPLRLRGEHEYPVPPLGLPPVGSWSAASLVIAKLTQYEAVRLFIERAQAVKPDFEVTNQNAPAVAEICVRLDGLPLAIELAAARVRLFPPQAMLSKLQSRLKLLTGGARDLPARQQTLRAAIEWSYDLLSEGEKQFFRRMAVFQGGRTLEAMEVVCGGAKDDRQQTTDDASANLSSVAPLQMDVLAGVESLVSNSLLQQRVSGDGEPRFWILETIHEYAREKLEENGEGPELRYRHAAYFTAMGEEAEAEMKGARQEEWLGRLEDEHDNLRAALRWARSNDSNLRAELPASHSIEMGLRLAGALYRFWLIRGYLTEGREELNSLLNAQEAAEPSLARAKALLRVGGLAWSQGDYAAARPALEESLEMYRQLGAKEGVALALLNLGNVALYETDYPTARSLYEESLKLYEELGDRYGTATALHNTAIVAQYQRDYEAARPLLQKSLAIRRELGEKMGIAQLLNTLGDVAWNLGEHEAARGFYLESLIINQALGYKWGLIESLEGLARVAGSRGEGERIAYLWGAAHALREAIGAPVPLAEREDYERYMSASRSQMEEATWSATWNEGEAAPLKEAIARASEQL